MIKTEINSSALKLSLKPTFLLVTITTKQHTSPTHIIRPSVNLKRLFIFNKVYGAI